MKKQSILWCHKVVVLVVFLFWGTTVFASEKPVRIYLDADMTGARASGVSIYQGMRTAFAVTGDRLGGRPVDLVVLDHRGNSRRSRKHLEKFVGDKEALAVFCGLHSPPVLHNLEFIHQNRIPLLDPWAAAGPITRYPAKANYVFRVSVDDTKAGCFLVENAVKKRGMKTLHLVLEKTGWGRSNAENMTIAAKDMGIPEPEITWFDWGLTEPGGRILIRKIAATKADGILFVGNAREGKAIVKAMAALPEKDRMPILSHWGITGGDFAESIPVAVRRNVDLFFLQTRFGFLHLPPESFGMEVFQSAKKLFPGEIQNPEDIKAPPGFVHAYDLTRILMAAVDQMGLGEDMREDRIRLRDTLENLNAPVTGLLKTYTRPFVPVTPKESDGHEGIGAEQYVMARYNDAGWILLLP